MIDRDMNLGQIKTRRLEISVKLAQLAEDDCELRRRLLVVEGHATTLHRELAELDFLEYEIEPDREKQ